MYPLDAVIPSNSVGGDPTGRSQLTISTPLLPSEYATFSTTRPEWTSALLPVWSVKFGGREPGARSNLTNPVTREVPLALETFAASNVCHVPPPVTACGSPGVERKVPPPVTVIFAAGVVPPEPVAKPDA